ncbi:putative ring-cleaving dioxygenase MhqO [Paenibacillus baekrokdamisoli]|uniref:Putative ring-cleaving dioxygenase MhqO n=1 Tax=Paenibacillus baekrokdamisoli TaxID=1712516 RepID=A0A3G9JKX3_9BACL|nr:ring-cleaving dioxygenase [Paenibacillus baekrokdamisoli]MBB3068852.1 glyoxalase family protein [Paenibacillus baekrokdamisoli]BBH23679.1 putative ring-cleaving dioxygenase MhqO [Paenibacillus baekrokdamisoli]
MTKQTAGIHHITAFVRNAQETVDFYSGVLGLRLVKKTINFDAPEVYHLYFGDQSGSPGTIITFFPWAHSRKGRIGGGQVGTTTYVVPPGTLAFWKERLARFQIPVAITERFSETYVEFVDPDGLQLELVEREQGAPSEWSFGGVPAEKAIKGFGGAILYSAASAKTARVLENVMGLEQVGQEGPYMRFQATGDLGNVIDVNTASMPMGEGGAGTVHHIAWRAKDDEDHVSWRNHVAQSGLQPTPVIDRQYFNAIYFREGGGILFEIATDPPGFANDEQPDQLGEHLMLPEWFEEKRADIVKNLPPIEVRVLEEDAK